MCIRDRRELEHNIVELEVADVEPLVEGYLPAAWFESGTLLPLARSLCAGEATQQC